MFILWTELQGDRESKIGGGGMIVGGDPVYNLGCCNLKVYLQITQKFIKEVKGHNDEINSERFLRKGSSKPNLSCAEWFMIILVQNLIIKHS